MNITNKIATRLVYDTLRPDTFKLGGLARHHHNHELRQALWVVRYSKLLNCKRHCYITLLFAEILSDAIRPRALSAAQTSEFVP